MKLYSGLQLHGDSFIDLQLHRVAVQIILWRSLHYSVLPFQFSSDTQNPAKSANYTAASAHKSYSWSLARPSD
jgi:hypothetical protein